MKTNHPSMSWKWQKGQTTTLADFGDPVHTDEYALCLYDESGAMPTRCSGPFSRPGRAGGRRDKTASGTRASSVWPTA